MWSHIEYLLHPSNILKLILYSILTKNWRFLIPFNNDSRLGLTFWATLYIATVKSLSNDLRPNVCIFISYAQYSEFYASVDCCAVCPNMTLEAMNASLCMNTNEVLLSEPSTVAFRCTYEAPPPSVTMYKWSIDGTEVAEFGNIIMNLAHITFRPVHTT